MAADAKTEQQIKEVFNRFDKDKSGRIEPNELLNFMQHIEPGYWTEDRINILLGEMDKNDNNAIDFHEFLSWVLAEDATAREEETPIKAPELSAVDASSQAVQHKVKGGQEQATKGIDDQEREKSRKRATEVEEQARKIAVEKARKDVEEKAGAENAQKEVAVKGNPKTKAGEHSKENAEEKTRREAEEMAKRETDKKAMAEVRELEKKAKERTAAAAAEAAKLKRYTLNIALIGAKNLRDADWFGKSDPYAITSVDNHGSKHRTKSVRGTLNPIWNESCTFRNIQETNTFRIVLFDDDGYISDPDPLGYCEEACAKFIPDGFTGDLKVRESGSKKEATVQVRITAAEQSGFESLAE